MDELYATRARESELKGRLVHLTRMLEKQYSGDSARRLVKARNMREGEAARAEKDRMFHRDVARSVEDEPRASEEELVDISILLNEAQRSIVPHWETPSWFKLFRHVDSDGSGLISYDEFAHMARVDLKLSEEQLSETKMKAVWLALDEDGSGCAFTPAAAAAVPMHTPLPPRQFTPLTPPDCAAAAT